MANIIPTTQRTSDTKYNLLFADDAKLRFASNPAGTHRLAVCYEAAKRLSKYQYAYYCPGISEFNVLPQWRRVILQNPAKYHVGSLYLTGEKDTSFQDTSCDPFIGRLGTYVNQVAARSTLCKSPHFQLDRVEGAPDFDPNWKSILIQMSRIRDSATSQAFTVEEVAEDMRQAHRNMSQVFSTIGTDAILQEPAAPN
jgi:hypothetical protein